MMSCTRAVIAIIILAVLTPSRAAKLTAAAPSLTLLAADSPPDLSPRISYLSTEHHVSGHYIPYMGTRSLAEDIDNPSDGEQSGAGASKLPGLAIFASSVFAAALLL